MDNKQRIPTHTAFLMIGTALFFDCFQVLLLVAGGLGLVLNRLVSLYAILTFGFWFKLRGVGLLQQKKFATGFITLLSEMIPGLCVLPGWTISTLLIILMVKSEDTLGIDVMHKKKKKFV